MNAVHDIDALSMAVPYCHVVVPDSEMANLLSRSRAGQRNETLIVDALADLLGLLTGLADQAPSAGDDAARWDWAASGGRYCMDEEDLLKDLPGWPPAA